MPESELERKSFVKPSVSDVLSRIGRVEPHIPQLKRPVDILVPVFRGRAFFQPFITSLLSAGLAGAGLIIVDDANDDAVVADILSSDQLRRPGIKIIRKEQNEGYVAAVCTAFDNRFHDGDVVTLNTDTVLPRHWLQRLVAPLQSGARIASTTPVTNSGSITSFPNFFKDNQPFKGMTTDDIDRTFARFDNRGIDFEIPTGVGFCMGMSAEAIATVGFLDRRSFGRGFGEEVDWCQRAKAAGFMNTIVPNLYVSHMRGGSFSAVEKAELLASSREVIVSRYPYYERDVGEYVKADPLANFRTVLADVLTIDKRGVTPTITLTVQPFSPNVFEEDWNANPVAFKCVVDPASQVYEIAMRVDGDKRSLRLEFPVDLAQIRRVFDPEGKHKFSERKRPEFRSLPEEEVTKGAIPYLDVLGRIHAWLKPRNYVQIGVRDGHSLALARCKSVGIDPMPNITVALDPKAEVQITTSDIFFAQLADSVLTASIDLAFINGLHLFEFALRDFMNIERRANAASVIVFDDIFPNHPKQAKRHRETAAWTGDVWKIVPCLQQYRPDLTLLRLDTAEAGLLLVAGLDPENLQLERNYDAILRRYRDDPADPPVGVVERVGALDPNDARIEALVKLLRAHRGRRRRPTNLRRSIEEWRTSANV